MEIPRSAELLLEAATRTATNSSHTTGNPGLPGRTVEAEFAVFAARTEDRGPLRGSDWVTVPDRSSSQLVEGEDYERADGEFRLLKERTLGCPVPVPNELRLREGTCSWEAEEKRDKTGEPLTCRLEYSSTKGWTLRLPCRYNWDGSSAPWLVRKILRIGRNSKKTLRATLHHDGMYEGMRARAIPPDPAEWTDERRKSARKWADQAMRHILKHDGYSRWKAALVYAFVRWRGSSSSKRSDDLRTNRPTLPASGPHFLR